MRPPYQTRAAASKPTRSPSQQQRSMVALTFGVIPFVLPHANPPHAVWTKRGPTAASAARLSPGIPLGGSPSRQLPRARHARHLGPHPHQPQHARAPRPELPQAQPPPRPRQLPAAAAQAPAQPGHARPAENAAAPTAAASWPPAGPAPLSSHPLPLPQDCALQGP